MLPIKTKVIYTGTKHADQMKHNEVGEVTGRSFHENWSQVRWASGHRNVYPDIDLKIIQEPYTSNVLTTYKAKETTMRKCISEVYEKTAEAVLVEKYADTMGIRNDTLFSQCVIKSNKAVFLAEAKRLEAESK